MSKRHQAKKKVSRALHVNLHGKANSPFVKRNYGPGQHGASSASKSKSDFGDQMMHKQRLRRYYGDVTEKQFRLVYEEAARMKGDTSQNLVGLLESRADIILYRAGIAPTIYSARQMISHKYAAVKDSANSVLYKTNVPSYALKPGAVLQLTDKAKGLKIVQESLEKSDRRVPSYLDFDKETMTVKFLHRPELAEIPYESPMHPNKVVELYSR